MPCPRREPTVGRAGGERKRGKESAKRQVWHAEQAENGTLVGAEAGKTTDCELRPVDHGIASHVRTSPSAHPVLIAHSSLHSPASRLPTHRASWKFMLHLTVPISRAGQDSVLGFPVSTNLFSGGRGLHEKGLYSPG